MTAISADFRQLESRRVGNNEGRGNGSSDMNSPRIRPGAIHTELVRSKDGKESLSMTTRTAQLQLRRLEREAAADSEMKTAEHKAHSTWVSGESRVKLAEGVTLFVTAMPQAIPTRRLGMATGYHYYLRSPDEAMYISRDEALAFLATPPAVTELGLQARLV